MDRHIPDEKHIVKLLTSGAVGVFPTDTLYGIVGSAQNADAVERIYRLRKRESHKPLIVLIADIVDFEIFYVRLSDQQRAALEKIWPAQVSVVLDCPEEKMRYLHRGGDTIALRMPAEKWLQEFLRKTGPLVAPSANISGEKPAETIEEARAYFGDSVDFYVDWGIVHSGPSTLIKLEQDGSFMILRHGAVKL